MRLNPTEKNYPNFNDSPHEVPVLTYDGTGRAVAWFAGIYGGTILLGYLLNLIH